MQRIPLWKLILTGVVALVVTVALMLVWNITFTRYLWASDSQSGDQVSDLGTRFWVLLSVGDVLLAVATVTIVGLFVSTLRQARDLRRQHTFLDSVTHELKSPLTSLRLGLETMLTRQVTPEMREKLCRMMLADVDRLQTFVEHALEAGRLQHNERELQYDPVDLPVLLTRCIDQITHRHRVSADAFRMSWFPAPPDKPVNADRVALDVIVINLLDNAVKYRRDDAPLQVDVVVRLQTHLLQIEIHDCGIGIPAERLHHIFGRFIRLPRRSGRPVRGTGLGLYVVSSLARRMGGRIRAASEGENKGTTMTVELPIPTDRPRIGSQQPAAETDTSSAATGASA